MKVKQIEISTTFGGVISEAPYENVKPSFTDKVVIDIDENDNEDEVRKKYRRKLQEEQITAFNMLKNRLKAELIKQQYRNIRLSERNGIEYPHVTSILNWAKEWKVPEFELNQYAARGTIIHYMIEQYLKTDVWLSLDIIAREYPEEVAIMKGGSLGLSIDDCSFKKFFEKYRSQIKVDKIEQQVFNDEYRYCGTPDAVGYFDGAKTVFDFKTGDQRDFRQLAAYAKCEDGIKKLVICPIGPTKNKCGYMNPVINDNINHEFERFLAARTEFKKRFGI